MADRARAVQEAFEARQDSTEQALDDLLTAIARNEARKKEQAATTVDVLGEATQLQSRSRLTSF